MKTTGEHKDLAKANNEALDPPESVWEEEEKELKKKQEKLSELDENIRKQLDRVKLREPNIQEE